MLIRHIRWRTVIKNGYDCFSGWSPQVRSSRQLTSSASQGSNHGLLSPLHRRKQTISWTLWSVRNFQTSKPHNVNPLLVAVLRPLSKVAAVLVGRGFRKWWQSLPKHKRDLFVQHFRRNMKLYFIGSVLAAGTGFTYYDNHVADTPFTGRKRFMVFTAEQLHIISKHAYEEEMESFGHLVMPEKHPMVQQVKRVGSRLLQGNKNVPQLYTKTWSATVIDHETINCFVLPSGYIIMFRGMMDLLDNDDQVAAILAHEMSHAILEHSAEQLSHGYLLDLVILLPLAVIWAFIPSDGLAVITHWFVNKVVEILVKLPYSRTLENEADAVGLQLAAKACFDVREASAFWGKMSVLDKIHDKKEDEVSWLSTHPTNIERQDMIDKQMSNALLLRDYCQCPKLKDYDPRYSVRKIQEKLRIPLPEHDTKTDIVQQDSVASVPKLEISSKH